MTQEPAVSKPTDPILIVDDDELSLRLLEHHLQERGFQVCCAASGAAALRVLQERRVDLVITDLAMQGMDGIQLLHAAKQEHHTLPFVVLTAEGSVETAVAAIKEGALDYLEKPFNPGKLELVLQRALEFGRLSGENALYKEHFQKSFSFHTIVTQSPRMRQVLELAGRVALSLKTTVSLTGESGVGKEVLARAIHCASGCLPGTFVAVNCAAIPESLLESELFGHARGAFTGADRDREGKFSLARGGTLLLDEIGDMPLGLQAKLLRVLEERTFEKVGTNKALPADFRVIVATHWDLEDLVRRGQFREDLFHRINVVPLAIPALRERPEDIPLLVEFYLDYFRRHLGKALPGITNKAMDLLVGYCWPGNVRELRNMTEYAAIMVAEGFIGPEHLRLQSVSGTHARPDDSSVDFHLSLPAAEISLANLTQQVLDLVLTRCDGNKSQAASLLKVNRKMFYR